MCRLLHQKLFICKEGKNNHKSRLESPSKGERIFFFLSLWQSFPRPVHRVTAQTPETHGELKASQMSKQQTPLDNMKIMLLCLIWTWLDISSSL